MLHNLISLLKCIAIGVVKSWDGFNFIVICCLWFSIPRVKIDEEHTKSTAIIILTITYILHNITDKDISKAVAFFI